MDRFLVAAGLVREHEPKSADSLSARVEQRKLGFEAIVVATHFEVGLPLLNHPEIIFVCLLTEAADIRPDDHVIFAAWRRCVNHHD